MLDDLRKIHERDGDDMLGIAAHEWEQLEYSLGADLQLSTGQIGNVVYSAMGGSAVAALLAPVCFALNKPFEVARGYDIPAYVGPNTLFIACSSSGNTEETLEALERAEAAGAQIAVIAGGGKLAEIAQQKHYPLILLPKIRQPRLSVFANLRALVALLSQAGVCVADENAFHETAEFLKTQTESWLPTVATKDNLAKQIAQECMGKSVVVYAGPGLAPAAYKWKIGFNENAKQIAWWGQYPECSHNELTGWGKQPEQKPYAVIDLRSHLEHPRVQKRFEATERLLSGLRPSPIVVDVKGKTPLQQLAYAVVLGDFVSIYAGLLNGLDPAPLQLVDRFKKVLSE